MRFKKKYILRSACWWRQRRGVGGRCRVYLRLLTFDDSILFWSSLFHLKNKSLIWKIRIGTFFNSIFIQILLGKDIFDSRHMLTCVWLFFFVTYTLVLARVLNLSSAGFDYACLSKVKDLVRKQILKLKPQGNKRLKNVVICGDKIFFEGIFDFSGGIARISLILEFFSFFFLSF